jgi:hypothetical protein
MNPVAVPVDGPHRSGIVARFWLSLHSEKKPPSPLYPGHCHPEDFVTRTQLLSPARKPRNLIP